MSVQLITHTKKDLELAVEIVVKRLRQQELFRDTSLNTQDDRLTQKEAAKFLDISVTSIIAWKKKGLVPYFQIGRSIFFSKKELLELAKKNREALNSYKK